MAKVADIRKQAATTLKKAVDDRERELRLLRQRELSKSRGHDDCLICNAGPGACKCLERMSKADADGEPDRPCGTCGYKTCKCPGVMPEAGKEVKVKEDGAGGGTVLKKIRAAVKKALEKADVPMAKPPTAAPNKMPTSKPALGKATAIEYGVSGASGGSAPTAPAPAPAAPVAPASPAPTAPPASGAPRGGGTVVTSPPRGGGKMAMSEGRIPGRSLAKALAGRPHLGGKDATSQMMTQHAASAAPVAAPSAAPAGPKLSPVDQARRAANFTDFTAAGAFTPAGAGTAQAGAMKPMASPAAPMGGGKIDRFRAALHGKPTMKKEPAPVKKDETGSPQPLNMSEEPCAMCGKKGSLCKCGY